MKRRPKIKSNSMGFVIVSSYNVSLWGNPSCWWLHIWFCSREEVHVALSSFTELFLFCWIRYIVMVTYCCVAMSRSASHNFSMISCLVYVNINMARNILFFRYAHSVCLLVAFVHDSDIYSFVLIVTAILFRFALCSQLIS